MPKILIVDDEPAIRALLRMKFMHAGYQVEVAENVTAAKKACMAQEFDAILSDVVMPDGNGHALMRWIAANRPATATILMTGFDSGCEKCPYSPRCKLLSKPFSPDEAVAMVADAIHGVQPTFVAVIA